MVELTLQIPNSLAAKIQSFGGWTSTVIEISLLNCTTKASLTAQEVIKFLEKNPSPIITERHSYCSLENYQTF